MIKHDNKIYGAFGVHPWFLSNICDDFEMRLEQLLKLNDAFMVGEIGLDKYKPDMDKQIDVFKKQFDIAVKLKRTIFLHCVGAWDKMLCILKQYKKMELPLIVAHGFNGSDEILKNLDANYNVLFSFSKIDKHKEIQRIQQINIDKILVETDANLNVDLIDVINKISHIKNKSNMSNIIYNNTVKVLKNG
jgi:TatD DNase family protein